MTQLFRLLVFAADSSCTPSDRHGEFESLGPILDSLAVEHRFNELTLFRTDTPDAPMRIDLHWKYMDDPSFFETPHEELFGSGSTCVIAGEPIPTLAPGTPGIVYLALHLCQHRGHPRSRSCGYCLPERQDSLRPAERQDRAQQGAGTSRDRPPPG